MNLIDFIKSHSLDKENELVFFGGSFNPWHEGHSSCIELMPADKKIIVIPDHNPFKELVKSDDKLTGISEIKDKLSKLNRSTFLFDGFLKDNEQNPTSIWIKELKSAFPNIELSLLMGFDSFMSIDKWINSETLLQNLASIYMASRLDNDAIKNKQLQLLKDISDIDVHFLGNHNFEHLASSQIRNQ